jgi:type II secretory pathway pseudopilin PulG
VTTRSSKPPRAPLPAFSLVELVTVIAVILLLAGIGAAVLRDPGTQARKTATDALTGLLEQARTTALTRRVPVVLAIAEPGDLPTDDGRCMIGLFQLTAWPERATALDGVLLRRWQALPSGVVLLPGGVGGLRNPRDEAETTIRYLSGQRLIQGDFHILAFNSRGSLLSPTGSDPVALRIAEGSYRNRQPAANAGRKDRIAENTLRIGRLTARPYRLDG